MPNRWQIELLGGASLRGNGVLVDPLERKAAAMLAYFALSGSTPRSKLAGLLSLRPALIPCGTNPSLAHGHLARLGPVCASEIGGFWA